jgi:hypothetical protein
MARINQSNSIWLPHLIPTDNQWWKLEKREAEIGLKNDYFHSIAFEAGLINCKPTVKSTE